MATQSCVPALQIQPMSVCWGGGRGEAGRKILAEADLQRQWSRLTAETRIILSVIEFHEVPEKDLHSANEEIECEFLIPATK